MCIDLNIPITNKGSTCYRFCHRRFANDIHVFTNRLIPKFVQFLDCPVGFFCITQFCSVNGIKISDEYSDIGSGINFERKEFQRLVNDVVNHKISKIYITYKDRLSRISFDMFKNLFQNFNCEIIVLNDIDDNKQIEKEIFNEIISLIHCFAMKVYSSRRQKKLKNIEEDLKIEIEEE
jgi:DNA invertase Pin-like site-specific DNA recombinase